MLIDVGPMKYMLGAYDVLFLPEFIPIDFKHWHHAP